MVQRIVKGLFASSSSKPDDAQASNGQAQNADAKPLETYQDSGFCQAGRLGGSVSGLRVCLQRIHHDYKQEVRADRGRQEQLMRPYRDQLNGHEHDAVRLLAEASAIKQDRVPGLKQRIESLQKEVSDIRQDPRLVIGEDTGKAGFVIGLVILTFLTVYLFLFYSSATYSAFFKEFTLSNLGVARSIFDPQAVGKALADGVMEVALILTIPFVFLGLGYLIHKVQRMSGWTKYPRIGLLILVTFVFDAILAYEITHKIYENKREGSFEAMPEYSTSMAMENVQFWMVIFAGFVVYIIWGLVFDIVMESHGKLDAVAVAIRERRKKVIEVENQLQELETEEAALRGKIAQHRKESARLKEFIEQGYVVSKDFEQFVFQFAQGWMAYMKGGGMSAGDMELVDKEVHEFVRIACGPTVVNSASAQ
ncbi:MAG: hypothetical protein IPI81_06675 [Flavobacteriales bacterium]|nr:hypothetical protein [Flavobacteriales bacterium]